VVICLERDAELHTAQLMPLPLTVSCFRKIQTGFTFRSLSLVMTECSLSGRGQGHVSNFYVVDLENFATESRRYTGDIHNSTIVGLFMTPIRQ